MLNATRDANQSGSNDRVNVTSYLPGAVEGFDSHRLMAAGAPVSRTANICPLGSHHP